MAAPTVDDLDGLLASLNQLKPPGASKNKVAVITTLCINNIQAETTIVQSFYRALKKAPATHKLGALYVIDSVVRQWIEKAKASGQDLHIGGRGEPGTYPAAVKRVTELMPALFDDIMKGIPSEQKPKLENMITIWERGNTFPAKVLAEFKSKLTGQSIAAVNGTHTQTTAPPPNRGPSEKFQAPVPSRPSQTPVGFPPRHLYDQGFLPGAKPPTLNGSNAVATPAHQQGTPMQTDSPARYAPPPSRSAPIAPGADVNSILAALSKAVPQAQASGLPQQQLAGLPVSLSEQLAALFTQQAVPPQMPSQQHSHPPPPQQHIPYPYPTPSAPPMPAPIYQAPLPSTPQGYQTYLPQPPPSIPQAYSVAPPPQPPAPQADPLAQLRGFLPENIINDHQKLIPALQLLQDLQKDGIPPDKWGPVLKAFEEQYQVSTQGHNNPQDYGRTRGRSRSPERGGRGGRGSPIYGSYDATSRNQSDDGRGSLTAQQRQQYRQRSPLVNTPAATAMNGRPMQPKFIGHDASLPPDNIKVLSRTLFVGGANGTQQEIQDLFERWGQVQTCIANRDKRHAFVKMTTRNHALAAKAGMEDLQNRNDKDIMNIARQTKWGVGFGPRECCDYQKGESVIPIHKLTDADMKWLLTAEYGGTGGQKLEGGMVLEEPDIEIGAGVSSKAMSKRIGPENSSQGKRHREDRERGGRHHKHHKGADGGFAGYSGVTGGPPPPAMDFGYARPEPVAVATPPAVPGFGFSLGLPPANGQNAFR